MKICPRCGTLVKSLAHHRYNVHTGKGPARRRNYEATEKARARKLRWVDRQMRRQGKIPT